jgi:hypothetical protein
LEQSVQQTPGVKRASDCCKAVERTIARTTQPPSSLPFSQASAAKRDKPMSTSLRLLAVLNVLLKYASARQAARVSYPRASPASRSDAL